MKKMTKLAVIAASLLAFAFTGCGNMFTDATVEGDDFLYGSRSVKINVRADGDIVSFGESSEARLIAPETIDATKKDGSDKDVYEFYMWGEEKLGVLTTSEQSALRNPKKVSFEAATGSKTTGTVELNLAVSQYVLKIVMVKAGADCDTEAEALQSAILYGSSTVDLRYNDTINFFLSPYSLKENGTAKLALYLDNWENDFTKYDVKGGIYKIIDGSAVGTATDYSATTLKKDKITDMGTDYANANFTSACVPGTYNFMLTFTPKTGSGLTKTYYYSDKIIILSNQVTSKIIAVPNIIEKKPDAPKAFYAGYVDPATPDDLAYDLHFIWKDNSVNEDYFQLEILELNYTEKNDSGQSLAEASVTAADTAITTILAGANKDRTVEEQKTAAEAADAAWTSLVPTATATTYTGYIIPSQLGKGFYQAPAYWINGALNKGNETATIRATLGKRYVVRLAAVNDAGVSDYVYPSLQLPTGGQSDPTFTSYKRYENENDTATATAFPANTPALNRFKINYNLNGGDFYLTKENDPADSGYGIATPKTKNTDKISGINKTGEFITRYYSALPANDAKIAKIINPLYEATTDTKHGILYNGDWKWTDWLEDSANGNIYKIDGNALGYTAHDSTLIEYTGFKNVTLFASYKVNKGTISVDTALDYNIKDAMVKVMQATASGVGSATDSTKTNGLYTFANDGKPSSPKYVYFALMNDNTNTSANGVEITYEKVVVEVRKNGGSTVYKKTSDATTSIGADGAGKTYSYVELPISTLTMGKYETTIYAYTNTRIGTYTYVIDFEITE